VVSSLWLESGAQRRHYNNQRHCTLPKLARSEIYFNRVTLLERDILVAEVRC